MAVQEQTPYVEYVANGITTNFALEFDCDNQNHLIVLVDDVEPVVGAWSLVNGAVVFNTAPENGKKITIQRNTPFSRTTDYQSYNNSFRPPAVNKDFDWIWWKLQELGVADWILSNRIDALKNYVDDRDDELRAYLMEEIRKQGVALDQLDEYYNYLMQRLAQIAVDKGWDASFVVDASGKTQQELNTAFFGKRWFAPLYGVKADGITDDSPALNAIVAQMETGDILEVLPVKHKLNTPLIIDKPIKITSNSIRYQSAGALFECETDGVVFKAPYITWEAINLVGKYTSTVLDPENGVYGSVGLNHELNSSTGGLGTIVRDTYVTYFDTNITEVRRAGDTWAGCYREYHNVFLRYGRINLVMMDGATLSNWHGGAIQLATERGVYLDCPTTQYNNVIFHGTALEKNGYIAQPFPTDSKKYYGLYAGRNSKITLMGTYHEDQSMFAENGGIIEIIGGYQHLNSRAFAKKFGVIAMYGGFGALTSKLSINENYATFLSTTSANTFVTQASALNKSCQVTSTSSGIGISIYSRNIYLNEYHVKDIKAVKLSFKYNMSSGYTANPNIVVSPVIRIVAVGGSDVSTSNMAYPQIELIGETGKDCTFEFVWKPRNGGSYLPLDATVSTLQIFFNIQNLDGSFCNFSSDNLNLLIKNIDVEVFGNQSVNLISELPKYGNTAARPANIGLFERGFIYYDTTLGQSIVWNGSSWSDVYRQTASSTTSAMSSASNAINTTDKTAGKIVYNAFTGLLYFAIGSTATAAWRPINGGADITPV